VAVAGIEDDLGLGALPPPLPRIPEGEYVAISRSADVINVFARRVLEMEWEIEGGPYARTRLRGWMPIPAKGKRPSRSSHIYRLHQLVHQDRPLKRGERISLSAFVGKMFRVVVVTVMSDHHKRPLAEGLKYSRVSHVVEKVA